MKVAGRLGKFCAVVSLLCFGGVAVAQNADDAEPAAETLQMSAGAHATPDIPAARPEGFAVLPFANRSGVTGLEWMSAGVPAIIADKLDANPGLSRAMPPFIVPAGEAAPIDDAAEALLAQKVAAAQGARWIFGGHVRRPNWTFELTVRLWQVDGGQAVLIGAVTGVGEFTEYSPLIDRALRTLLERAGRPMAEATMDRVARVPTKDFYAFTLYGRGLANLHGLGKKVHSDTGGDVLKRVVFIDPKFAEAHRLLAAHHRASGNAVKARGQYRWALDLRPDFHAALTALIRMNREEHEGDDTLALIEQALALRPDDLEMRLYHGEMLWEAGFAELAQKELLRLLAVRPDDANARRIMVLIHASKGDNAELVKELEKLCALLPDDVMSRLDLAAAYRRVGRDPDAIAAYEAVLEKDPKHLQALKFLGDLYKSNNETKKAIAMYERALASNRADPRPYFLLGEAYGEIGDIKSAERVYLRAQRFPKYIADAYNMLGAIYYKRREYSSALWYLQQAVKKRPNLANVHYNLGLVLSVSDRTDRALRHLRVAADLDPDDGDIRYAQGVVLLRMGKLEAAEAAFKDALVRAPSHADALANLKLIADLRRRATSGEAERN